MPLSPLLGIPLAFSRDMAALHAVTLLWRCPQILEVVVDASNVPGEYALTILSECAAFPRRLVFFLKGSLTVRALIPPCLYHPPRLTPRISAMRCLCAQPVCTSPPPLCSFPQRLRAL